MFARELIDKYRSQIVNRSECRLGKNLPYAKAEEGGIGCVRDTQKINATIARLGFFIIVETDFEASSLDVLMTYRQRDVVEKSFVDLKNELDMKRLHCCSDETTEGKMFVAFFALILRSCLQNRLRTYMAETGLTFSSLLKELREMKYVHTHDGKRLLSPITKKQRDILSSCGLSTDD